MTISRWLGTCQHTSTHLYAEVDLGTKRATVESPVRDRDCRGGARRSLLDEGEFHALAVQVAEGWQKGRDNSGMLVRLSRNEVLSLAERYLELPSNEAGVSNGEAYVRIERKLAAARHRGHMIPGDMRATARWKYRGTRLMNLIGENTPDEVAEITRVSFAATTQRLRVSGLVALRGIVPAPGLLGSGPKGSARREEEAFKPDGSWPTKCATICGLAPSFARHNHVVPLPRLERWPKVPAV